MSSETHPNLPKAAYALFYSFEPRSPITAPPCTVMQESGAKRPSTWPRQGPACDFAIKAFLLPTTTLPSSLEITLQPCLINSRRLLSNTFLLICPLYEFISSCTRPKKIEPELCCKNVPPLTTHVRNFIVLVQLMLSTAMAITILLLLCVVMFPNASPKRLFCDPIPAACDLNHHKS